MEFITTTDSELVVSWENYKPWINTNPSEIYPLITSLFPDEDSVDEYDKLSFNDKHSRDTEEISKLETSLFINEQFPYKYDLESRCDKPSLNTGGSGHTNLSKCPSILTKKAHPNH